LRIRPGHLKGETEKESVSGARESREERNGAVSLKRFGKNDRKTKEEWGNSGPVQEKKRFGHWICLRRCSKENANNNDESRKKTQPLRKGMTLDESPPSIKPP